MSAIINQKSSTINQKSKINKRLTICSCASRPFIGGGKVATLASVLGGEGYDVTVEPDLCKTMMHRTADIETLVSAVILACYPRAVRALFRKFGTEPRQIMDIRNRDVEDTLSGLGIAFSGQSAVPEVETDRETGVEAGHDAWYPVIDKDRCTECRQCHDFCLFGVYATEHGTVKVTQPQNCKNNCPACARICPAKAIIFPKYAKSPINGGLEDEEVISADAKAVYADALRMRLQQRRASVSLKKTDNDV